MADRKKHRSHDGESRSADARPASEPPCYDVFISYSSKDKEWVRGELLPRIEQAGLKAFIDFRDFTRGAPSLKEMERGVLTCTKTLAVLTPTYIKSRWAEIENIMAQALDPANRDLRLLPLLKTNCKTPLRIAALTHIDFTDGADLDLAWRQLLTALGSSPEPPEQPQPGTALVHRAFLAATGRDLCRHIRRGIEQLHAAGFEVVPWDSLESTEEDLTSFTEDDLDGCDLYVLLMAFRRGPLLEGGKESVTQLSLQRAMDRGIRVVVFLLDEDAPWQPRLIESRRDPLVETWREQLQETLFPRTFSSDPATLDLRPLLETVVWELKEQKKKDRRKALEHGLEEKEPPVDCEALRRSVLEAAKLQVRRARERLQAQGKYKPESYVRRRLDYVLDRFYANADHTCVLVVDDPGTGKSSLLAFQASQLVERGVPCLLLASDEYLEFGGPGCASFEDFALRALKAHLPDGPLKSSACFSSLIALCNALPAAAGATKLVIMLDGLNEIHSAGQASQGYQQDSVIGSKALLTFVEESHSLHVKLLVTSRRLTWTKLYEPDSQEWKDASWEPNWLALNEGDFLGGVRLQDLLPGALGIRSVEQSADRSERLICLPLGPFTDLEASMAMGIYQRVNRVRVAPGPIAFRQLTDPFFLGICFSAWLHRREERAETWHYVYPRDEVDSSGDLRIPVVNAFDSFKLMAGFWQAGEDRVMDRARREAPLAAMGLGQVRALMHHIVDQMTRVVWATRSDRVPTSSLADSPAKDLVKQAMIAEEMIVEETAQDGERQVRFPRDRVAGFHIVRYIRDQLNLGRQGVLHDFVQRAEEQDLFGGLLEMVLSVCLNLNEDLAWDLLETAIWRDSHQPQWFIEVCQHLPRLQSDKPRKMRERVAASLLWRFASLLAPRQSLGELPAEETSRREHVITALGANNSDNHATDPATILDGLTTGVVLSLSPMARQIISQLPRFFSPAREIAEGIEKMVDCVMRGREQRQEQEEAGSAQTSPGADANKSEVVQTKASADEGKVGGKTESQTTRAVAGKAKNEGSSDDHFEDLSLEHEYHNLGNDYYKVGEFDKAIEHYNKAIGLKSDLLETYFNRGLAYTRKAHYDRAIDDLNKVIELAPNLAEGYYTRGLIHEYKQDYDLAILDYNMALEVDPSYSKADTQRTVAENKRASLASSFSLSRTAGSPSGGRERVLEVQESIAAGSMGVGFCGDQSPLDVGGPPEELRDSPLSRAAEHNDLADYYCRAGQWSNAEKHSARAIVFCNEAMKNEQERLAASFIKALAMIRLSNCGGALDCIADALALNEHVAELYYLRGILLCLMDRQQEAAHDFRKAIAESPRWCKPSDLGRLSKARLAELAEKYSQLIDEPEEARMLYDQALQLASLGSLTMAGEKLHEAVKAGLVLTLQRLDNVASEVWSGGRTRKAIGSFLSLLWSNLSLSGEQLSTLVGKIGAAFSDVGDVESDIDYTLAASVLAGGKEAWLLSNIAASFLETTSPFYDPVAALREATTATSLDGSFTSAWNCRAEASRRLSMADEAIDAYRHSRDLGGFGAALARLELAVRFPERVGEDETRRLLEAARESFSRDEQQAAERYTIASMVYWLYAAARTCAILGDETYRTWANKAFERAFRTEGLQPYCWTLDRNGTIKEFEDECHALAAVFRENRR